MGGAEPERKRRIYRGRAWKFLGGCDVLYMLRPLIWVGDLGRAQGQTVKDRAKHLLCVGMLTLALGACASVSKAVDDARDLANHRAEVVAYPNLADVPAKPTPLTNSEQRKQTIQALQADRATVDAQAADLRNQAAAMPPVQVPGQPAQAAQPVSSTTPPPAQPQ
jgi:hypothetical protein